MRRDSLFVCFVMQFLCGRCGKKGFPQRHKEPQSNPDYVKLCFYAPLSADRQVCGKNKKAFPLRNAFKKYNLLQISLMFAEQVLVSVCLRDLRELFISVHNLF